MDPVRYLTLFAMTAAAFLLPAGCGGPGSGACMGEMSGRYFQLQVSNYTENEFNVFINDREIGDLGDYRGAMDVTGDGNPDTVPGSASFGEFPVCDGWVVDARGTDASRTEKFCSQPPFLECGGIPDLCTMDFLICEEIEDGTCFAADDNPVNYNEAPPSALCGECGPLSWERC